MEFVKIPYLPKRRVTAAVADLACENVNIIRPCPSLLLPENIKHHADLSFCYLGEGVAVCAKGSFSYYSEKLKDVPLKLIEGETCTDIHYPLDAAYNVAIVGKYLFCKKEICDRALLKEAEKMGYEIINIKQGYAKCSVCPVDEKSAISADKSFYKAAQKVGIDVLLITNDTILLPGYSCGFFGGASYMEDEKTLVVNGNIKTHPHCEKIEEFLKKRNITIKSKEGNLFDFGSFIPFLEE